MSRTIVADPQTSVPALVLTLGVRVAFAFNITHCLRLLHNTAVLLSFSMDGVLLPLSEVMAALATMAIPFGRYIWGMPVSWNLQAKQTAIDLANDYELNDKTARASGGGHRDCGRGWRRSFLCAIVLYPPVIQYVASLFRGQIAE